MLIAAADMAFLLRDDTKRRASGHIKTNKYRQLVNFLTELDTGTLSKIIQFNNFNSSVIRVLE